MKNKLFESDKNIILKKTQYKLRNKLLRDLIFNSIKEYKIKNNSLGIIDSVIESIENYNVKNEKEFYYFYNKIAAIYRFKYGNNQFIPEINSKEYTKNLLIYKDEYKINCT